MKAILLRNEMKNIMKKILSLLILTMCFSGLAVARDLSIKIINRSDYAIYHLYLSPSSFTKWGPDQLGDNVLSKNQSITITDIPEGMWDFKFIDEDGDVCIVPETDTGSKDFTWEIYNDVLLECEGFGN